MAVFLPSLWVAFFLLQVDLSGFWGRVLGAGGRFFFPSFFLVGHHELEAQRVLGRIDEGKTSLILLGLFK